jgi:hypothetical protein
MRGEQEITRGEEAIMGRDRPAKKQKAKRTDADIAELSPDEIMPAGDIHGPGGPTERLERGAQAVAPRPRRKVEYYRGVEVPHWGYILPPSAFFPASVVEPGAPAAAAPRPAAEPEHVHGPGCSHGHGPAAKPLARDESKVGRNDLCPCGSGLKHKKCCGK